MMDEKEGLMQRLQQLQGDVSEVIAAELRNAVALRNKARLTLVFVDSRETCASEAVFERMAERLRSALLKADKAGRFNPSTGEPR